MKTTSKRGVALWVVQGLLAALFLFAGIMKLVLPIQSLQGPVFLPGLFVRFIGVAEVAGGLGLVLPGLLRVWRGATPLAATGLVAIMSGAVVLTLEGGMVGPSLVPLVVGALAAAVVVGRRDWSAPRSAARA